MRSIFSKIFGPSGNKIHHPTHRHTLKLESKSKGFVCKACGLLGTGSRYECNRFCDWNIHDICAAAPDVLSTHDHRGHQLNLIWTKVIPDEHEGERGPCGVCNQYVGGRLFYSCPFCPSKKRKGFFLHTTCATYPPLVSHPVDKDHHLTWQSGRPTLCTICEKRCPNWHYRCEPCSIDVHFECASFKNASSAHGNCTGGNKMNGVATVIGGIAKVVTVAAAIV